MSYRLFVPDGKATLVELARALRAPVVCHRRDLAGLLAAGVTASTLAHGGPLPGELWVAAEVG